MPPLKLVYKLNFHPIIHLIADISLREASQWKLINFNEILSLILLGQSVLLFLVLEFLLFY
ncbi:hypothetical protein DB44_DS00020 [Candidatus Protochlamydia amoebophila]|uniref:Uncharacterized protein n=1 Tax=Candidatus Protochlamydia amoebophila TaxID=362787 RepID=A0A0C1H963_9BACT|nr:hypothetical protein DB44_DS00020 [Candidatus Protochlamydia amoebophila]